MTRTIRSVQGLIVDQGATLVAMLAVFVATPILVRGLGEADYGFWMVVMQLLGYIGLVDPGLGLQVTRAVSGQQEPAGLPRFLATTFYVQLGFAAMFLVAGTGLGVLFWKGGIAFSEGNRVHGATFFIAVLVGALGVITGYFVAVLSGRQRLVETGLIGSLQQTLGLAAGTLAVWLGTGLGGLALAYLAVAGVALLLALVLARRHESRLSFRLSDASAANLPSLVTFSLYFQMTKAAVIVLATAPSLVIAALIGPSSVAIYLVSTRLALTSGSLISRAANVLYPGISELMARRDDPALRRVAINMQYLSARVGFAMAPLILLVNETFVRVWVGSSLYGGALLTVAICCMILRDVIIRSLGVFIFADGNMRGLGWFSLVEAVVTVVLTGVFTLRWGIAGAALAPLISTVGISSPYVVGRVARILQISVRELLWAGTGRALVRSILPTLVAVLAAQLLPRAWGWGWLFAVGGTAILANVVAFDVAILWRTRGTPWSGRLRLLLEAR